MDTVNRHHEQRLFFSTDLQAAVQKAEADLEMAREQQHLVNARSALRQAEAQLLKCNQDVERLKPLAARRAVPQRDMDTAVAAQSSAVAAVEDARATSTKVKQLFERDFAGWGSDAGDIQEFKTTVLLPPEGMPA